MPGKTKIEWATDTWNPVTGCTKVSAGCKHCYAEREWARLSAPGQSYEGRAFTDVRCHPERLEQPLRWAKPRRVFVNSMSDLFHEDVPDDFLDQVFAVIALCQKHTFQVLTKRPERMCAYLRERASDSSMWSYWIGRFVDKSSMESVGRGFDIQTDIALGISLRNVWLGVSVEDQATADERIPLLLRVPAAVRWVSCEPLLGPIRLGDSLSPIIGLDWVVVGGESGPKARPMHPDWVASLRDQCQDARVPFFFKQWGTWGPGPLLTFDQRCRTEANFVRLDGTTHTYADREIYAASDVQMYRVGKRVAGRLLDGVLHDAYPE